MDPNSQQARPWSAPIEKESPSPPSEASDKRKRSLSALIPLLRQVLPLAAWREPSSQRAGRPSKGRAGQRPRGLSREKRRGTAQRRWRETGRQAGRNAGRAGGGLAARSKRALRGLFDQRAAAAARPKPVCQEARPLAPRRPFSTPPAFPSARHLLKNRPVRDRTNRPHAVRDRPWRAARGPKAFGRFCNSGMVLRPARCLGPSPVKDRREERTEV